MITALQEQAHFYAGELGWPVFPVRADKRPLTAHGFKEASTDAAQIAAWWSAHPDAGIAIPTGARSGLWVLDDDSVKRGPSSLDPLVSEHGALPETLRSRTGGGGLQHFFRLPAEQQIKNRTGVVPGIDVRGEGGYVLIPPSPHLSGNTYAWEVLADLVDAPAWLIDLVTRRVRATQLDGATTNYGAAALKSAVKRIASAQEGQRNDTLNREAFSIARLVAGGAIEQMRAFDELGAAATAAGLDEAEIVATLDSAFNAGELEPRSGPSAPRGSEEAFALAFADRHVDRFRFCQSEGWREWDGARWQPDDALRHFTEARTLVRELARNAEAEAEAKRIASSKSVAATVHLARADARLIVGMPDWDVDEWLLNTPSGTIDLRTGLMRAHARSDLITKVAAVAPGGECSRWLQFLDEVTGNDPELVGFLRRVSGYCLTGNTREHVLLFAYGAGANGKSVFIDTLAGILADYARTAFVETFTENPRGFDRHPTEIAMLKGARLVAANETEAGRAWAESRIKSITGGDRIVARHMRKDPFEFTPQFKLLIVGNHKPRLRSVGEAMRRRLRLIPFDVTIPPEKRDNRLTESLRAEWSGILRWAVEGCLEWQRDGLKAPERVLAATASYFGEEDGLAAWLEDAAEVGPELSEHSAALWTSWRAWSEASGERAGSRQDFARRLEERGFTRKKGTGGARQFAGLRLHRSIRVAQVADHPD
jgi:putative DNA primase/helicase